MFTASTIDGIVGPLRIGEGSLPYKALKGTIPADTLKLVLNHSSAQHNHLGHNLGLSPTKHLKYIILTYIERIERDVFRIISNDIILVHF